MKICVLEHPRIASTARFNDIANTPLWSCLMGGYAASALAEADFETVFLDATRGLSDFEATGQKILSLAPDLLCVNAVYFWEHTENLFAFLIALKKQGFEGHTNLFGFFPSLVYREILAYVKAVDSVAVGEFEPTLVELASTLTKGKAPDKIEGLAVQRANCLPVFKRRAPVKNPDVFAYPQRASLEGTVAILASRGCYNQCRFCLVPSFYNQGPLWRGRSPANIAHEIEELVEEGARDFYFVDPNFIGPGKSGKRRTMDLMARLNPLKVRFGMETRAADLDEEILETLAAAGLSTLLMGLESGSHAVLQNLAKHAGTKDGDKAIALCRQYGIEPEIGFLMFVPDSRVKDLRENMAFLMANGLLDRLDRTANLLSHCQIVLAGTSGYRVFEQKNRLHKKGLFGFEGQVKFVDPSVEWISELVVFACHMVLRSMGDPQSPVYWQTPQTDVAARLNSYLVDTFFELLDKIEKKRPQDNYAAMQAQIATAIHAIIK